MILEPDTWYLGYSQILKDCRADDEGVAGSALILCNADVDSMAAARILSYMLRSDGISYHLLPCMSFSQLNKILTKNMAEDVRSVILLNIGATRNLTQLFEEGPQLDPSIKVFVIDCRRPVHLANIHSGNNVIVFWDAIQNEDIPSDGDNLSGHESSSSSSEEDDSSDEESSDEENEFVDDDDEGEQEFGEEENDPTRVNNLEDSAEPDFEEEQSSDYDGDGEDNGRDPSKKKKRRTEGDEDDASPIEEASGDEDNGDEEDDDDKDETNKGRPSVAPTEATEGTTQGTTQQPTLTPREMHEARRNRIRSYYSTGTFWGSPAAFVAFRVSTQLRFHEVGDLLWLACVGITDAYLHSRLDVAGYTSLAMNLRNHCNRLFPNSMSHRVANTIYAEHLTTGSNRDTEAQDLTKIGFSENGRVLCETDFRFFLLRHTSLFDAMVYSDFVSTRFQLSSSRGMHKLQELLAKMGYPLEECHQPFAFMKPSLRRRLREQIREHAEEYGLENFEFTSFFRITGYQSLLSASDTSLAVTALLELDQPTNKKFDDPEEAEEDDLLQAFNIAFDALNSNTAPTMSLNGLAGEGSNVASLVNGGSLSGSTGLGAGIRLAIKLQRSIMATAASLIDRNAITRLSHFRYAYITCTSQGEHQGSGEDAIQAGESTSEQEQNHIFAKPLALSRLAQYLMDLHRENGRWTGAKARPLILMAEKPRTKSFLVAGYEYPESAGHFVKNRFGKNFELAAQSMKGSFKFDSFDSNVVEVKGSDVQRFIEQLHYLMESI